MPHCSSVLSCGKKKKLCLCHFGGANQSSPLQLPELIWRWTVSQKRKRGERRESERKTEGKAQRKRGNPPFFCSPGWSLHPGPQRGTEYTSSPQWGNHRGCCSQCVCVWACVLACMCSGGAALSRPLSGLIALEYSSPRTGSEHGGLLEGLALAPRQPHSAKEPRHNAHN